MLAAQAGITEDIVEGRVRYSAARSLVKVHPRALVPGLVERLAATLEDPKMMVRHIIVPTYMQQYHCSRESICNCSRT